MRFFLNLLMFFFPLFGMAQIQVETSQLPKVGDTLLFAVDNLPSGIQVGVPGENQRWDFTTLQSPYTQRTTWMSIPDQEENSPFPRANLFLPLGENSRSFYESRKDGTVYQWGAEDSDPLGLGIIGKVVYTEPELYRRAPLAFGDRHQHTYRFSQTIAADQLPDALFDDLPITPDSFRVSLIGDRNDEVDAWGRMLIPGGFFDALREKRTTTQRLKVEAKLGRFPWQDITGLIPSEAFPQQRTTVSYVFYSDELPEPLAWVDMGFQERFVRRVTYAVTNQTTNIQEAGQLEPGVYAFPNPAIINVRFEFTNLPAGEYELTIMNILGIEVWKNRFYLQGNRTERVDISELRKGTYLYSLRDIRGKILTTKRLVVVRP